MNEPERGGKKRRAQRWTTAHARDVIEQWRTSGQSAAVFARAQGISATRLSYWAKQVDEVAVSAPQFVAVPVAARSTMVRAAIEIEIQGVTLRVHEGADAKYVAQLLAALQTRGARRC